MIQLHSAVPPKSPADFSGVRVHCLGVGGIGMSAITRLLAERGAVVSGCDTKDSTLCDQLRAAGIHVSIGHDPAHVKNAECLVVSSAVSKDSAEYAAAVVAGIPVLHRSEALARIGQGSIFIAVAGTHGKTTTSSMLAVALDKLGKNPSFAVGGIIAGIGSNARYVDSGEESLFIAEVDESDGSFLSYDVDIAIITNIEADHLDYYGTMDKVEAAFEAFIRKIPAGGTAVLCLDDAGVLRLVQRLIDNSAPANIIGYGRRNPESLDPEIMHIIKDYYYMQGLPDKDLAADRQGTCVSGIADDTADGIEVYTSMPGEHNTSNAVAVFAVSQLLGAGAGQARDAIAAFPGVARRFELKGEAKGIKLYDDYAHHPTEVQAVLQGARKVAGNHRLHVIFQPHLYSRTQEFAVEFARSLDIADRILVLGIYGARENPIAGVTSQLITDNMNHAVNNDTNFTSGIEIMDSVVASVRFTDAAQPGDIVMTVGAGDVTRLGPILLDHMLSSEQEIQ